MTTMIAVAMSGESAAVEETDGEQIDERTAKLLGTASGVGNGVAIAAASYFVFDTNALVFGALVGVFSAIGSGLLLPWVFQQQDDEAVEEETGGFGQDGSQSSYSTPSDEGSGGLNTAALGAGLEAGAIGMFAARVALEEIVLAVGAGVAAALGVFLIASVLFGRVSG
jgi:hypothetical protein